MASLQKEIKISKSDFDILIGGGSITKGGITYTYDENALYLVDEDIKEAEWGKISGTISNQTDLQNILNLKANTSDLAEVATSGSYNDLSDKPTIPTVPTTLSSFTDDLGNTPIHTHSLYLTEYTETDPTVPAWAKEDTKPTYTALEVGALPSSTSIPTKTSDLENDSNFLTSHLSIKTINGLTVTGTGNVNIVTYNPFPSTWITSGSLSTVVNSILGDSTYAKLGMAYLGQISGECTPFGYGVVECKVEFMTNGLAILTVNSSNIPPYSWYYNTWSGDYIWKYAVLGFKENNEECLKIGDTTLTESLLQSLLALI